MSLNLPILFLVFARIFTMIQITPVLSAQSIPYSVRAGLALFSATLVTPVLQASNYPSAEEPIVFMLLLLIEITIGLILGFYLIIIFMIFELIAQMFSLQMGFAAAEMFDPLTNNEIPLIGQLLNLGSFYILIQTFGLHKFLLIGIENSFLQLNASTFLLNPESLVHTMTNALASTFSQALLMALPIIGSLFILSITLGLMTKAAPQMNLLMVGFPLQVSLGLFMLIITIPALFNIFETMLEQTWYHITNMISGLRKTI